VRARLPAFGRHQCRKLSIGCARPASPTLQARLVDRRHHESMWPRGRNWQARITRRHTRTPPPSSSSDRAGCGRRHLPTPNRRSEISPHSPTVAVDPVRRCTSVAVEPQAACPPPAPARGTTMMTHFSTGGLRHRCGHVECVQTSIADHLLPHPDAPRRTMIDNTLTLSDPGFGDDR
jgi:hypothetical protein